MKICDNNNQSRTVECRYNNGTIDSYCIRQRHSRTLLYSQFGPTVQVTDMYILIQRSGEAM